MKLGCLFARRIHPEIAGLAHYASELAGDAALPRRSLFDPARIPGILDYVYMADILEDDYFFSFFGERMPVLYGADLGGTRLSEMEDPALRHSLRKTYDCVVQTELPLFMRGYYIWSHRSVPIERLLIPMTSDEGVLSAICGISVPEVAHVDLEMYTGHGPARLVGEDELMQRTG